jgi:Ser/Thr protein kinase RdoA (MazF antagonist)
MAATVRRTRDILEGNAGRIIACWEGTRAAQPVHGDLWPGNLLAWPHGLRAIDFAEAGDGPRTIDMATAFRWVPWRDDPARAAVSWESWLAGYGEVGVISQAELDSIPPLACLQHLIWMIAEVVTSTGAAESSWYVEDHCSAVQALLSSATR